MTQYGYGVHWLSFVVTGPKDNAFMLYDLFFKPLFGDLQSMGHGGRGFDTIWRSLLEFKVYVTPKHGTIEFFHFEIPSEACELIPRQVFQGLEPPLEHVYMHVAQRAREIHPGDSLIIALGKSPELATAFVMLTFVMPPVVVTGLVIDFTEQATKRLARVGRDLIYQRIPKR